MREKNLYGENGRTEQRKTGIKKHKKSGMIASRVTALDKVMIMLITNKSPNFSNLY